jgi:hypothetical protein
MKDIQRIQNVNYFETHNSNANINKHDFEY